MLLITRPEFYDFFGFSAFLFITILSIWSLKTKNNFPKWAIIVLMLIGVVGLIVDGVIVSNFIFS